MKKNNVILIALFLFLIVNIVSAATYTTEGVSNTQRTDATPIPSVGSNGGSGGSGGGGVVTDESFLNIARSDRKEKDLRTGQIAAYDFNLDVYKIELMPLNNELGVTVKVEELKDRSSKTPTAPDGEVYKYFNVYTGTQRISESTIYFSVPASQNGIRLMRWNPATKVWDSLNTVRIDDAHYSAKTAAFSNFAIVRTISKAATIEVVTPAVATPAPRQPASIPTTPAPAPTPVVPGFEMFGAISLLLGAYAWRRGK